MQRFFYFHFPFYTPHSSSVSFRANERNPAYQKMQYVIAGILRSFAPLNDIWVTDKQLPTLALPLGELASKARLRGHAGDS